MRAGNPKAMWIGVASSGLLLLIFMALKYSNSPVLSLDIQWLFVALVPILIGLIVGGYVREVKAGEYGVGFATDEILAKSQPVPDSSVAGPKKELQPTTGWQSARQKEYDRTRGYMLAHIYRPSKAPGQKFDISIFVVRHQKGTTTPPRSKLSELKSAEFFFGDSWGNRTFAVQPDDGFFGVRTHAWGTFLASCRISFNDPTIEPIILYRYIDFSMAEKSD